MKMKYKFIKSNYNFIIMTIINSEINIIMSNKIIEGDKYLNYNNNNRLKNMFFKMTEANLHMRIEN
jgi:hypothetical protein